MEEILSLFRVIAPEFAEVSDEEIKARIDFVKPLIGKNFGELYTRAVALYTAHVMTLQRLIADEGATGGVITSGAITREREGDLERSYGGENSGDLLSKTAYGKQYSQLLKMCIVSVKTRFG